MYTSSIATNGRMRSTVSWIIVLPSLVSERNCLGRLFLLLGQKRSPRPPAMINAVVFIIFTSYLSSLPKRESIAFYTCDSSILLFPSTI